MTDFDVFSSACVDLFGKIVELLGDSAINFFVRETTVAFDISS